MKKATALVVIFLMIFTAACSGGNSGGGGGGGTALEQAASNPEPEPAPAAAEPESKDSSDEPAAAADNVLDTAAAEEPGGLQPYVIDYMMLVNSVAANELPIVTEALNKITQEKFNATVNITMLPWGDWFTVVNTMLNAGEKVDIVFTADWWQYPQSVANNYFLPLNDLIDEYAPVMKAQLGETFIVGSQIDGINYGIPTDKELAVNGGFLWNKNLADKYGLVPDPTWKSYGDWEPFLEIIRENEPDVMPILTDGALYHIDFIGYLPCETGWDARDPKDTKLWFRYELPYITDEYRAVRDLYQKGYIPPDSAISDNDWMNQHLSMGDFFLTTQPLKPGKGKSTELMSAAINQDVVYDEFETTPLLVNTTHCGGSMLAIANTSKDPARAMMFINEMHTNPELSNLLSWGVEGVTYEVVGHEAARDFPIVRPIEGNQWTGAVLVWTLGNIYNCYLADYEPLDKYDLLGATKVGIPGHVANGFRFDPEQWLDTITAVNSGMGEYARVVQVGAVDTDEGLSELIRIAESAGYRDLFNAMESDFQAWLAEQ